MNILQFIRKTLLPNNCKYFDLGVEALQEAFNRDQKLGADDDEYASMVEEKAALLLPEFWDCTVHDKNLLIAVNNNGFDFLASVGGNKEYGFKDVLDITPDVAFKRIEEICEFFKDYQQHSKVVKKTKKEAQNQAHGYEGGAQQQRSFGETKKKVAKVQL